VTKDRVGGDVIETIETRGDFGGIHLFRSAAKPRMSTNRTEMFLVSRPEERARIKAYRDGEFSATGEFARNGRVARKRRGMARDIPCNACPKGDGDGAGGRAWLCQRRGESR
jgi:hypothetical protein